MKITLFFLALLASSGAFCQSEEEKTIDSLTVNNNPFGEGSSTACCQTPCFLSSDVHEYELGANRKRLNDVQVSNLQIKEDAVIHYKLIVDSSGNVVDYAFLKSKSTTTDWTLVNRIGVTIKHQVKYNRLEEKAPLVYQYYTVRVKAN